MSSRTAAAKRLAHTANHITKPLITPVNKQQLYNHYQRPIPNELKYLNSLPAKTLFSYFAIGCCTINKPVLNTVIKLFPYIPFSILNFFIGDIYIGGSTPDQVIKKTEQLNNRGINNVLLSLTIENSEGSNQNIDINYIVDETVQSLHSILKPQILTKLQNAQDVNEIAPSYIVLKPSALVDSPVSVLSYPDAKENKSNWEFLVNNCNKVTEHVERLNKEFKELFPERKASFFITCVDAENFAMQQGVYKLQRELFQKFNKINKPVQVVGTVQMYLRSSIPQIELEDKIAKQQGYKVGLKLVRGAYIHSEPDRDVIFATKEETDANYDTGVNQIVSQLDTKQTNIDHLVIATHNKKSSLSLLNQITPQNESKLIVGQLLGMADELSYELINDLKFKKLIKYVPWGPPLETKDYLLRRLQENGDAVRNDNGWKLIFNIFRVLKLKVFG
ncbi:hypothetical protein WICMUC_001322 [Wickerhamomyces mucosus]|uniref:Proline dehydrogenase n=1 Tax=Wickerhamomyces mucosus TaxID=1378264 RepID=A0A9P8PX40_9ASCO|nr:hypothetical protein WICMUC_001322 [Wickerhamomyces mucosus]